MLAPTPSTRHRVQFEKMDALVPASTRKTRVSARSAFARFLKQQDVSEDYVHACIRADASGARLVAVVESFGMYLVCSEGKDGNFLALNSVLSYFRNMKVTLIDMYPLQRVYAESALMGKASLLTSACKRRKDGGFVHSAPPCTKSDLSSLLHCMYANASNDRDYQDAALFCLMWHCFGRASDLAFARKEHLAMSADGALFVRLLRVKTTQEQGLTLAPERTDFLVCPLFALGSALAMQRSPSAALLSQLPSMVTPQAIAAEDTVPLYALLQTEGASLRDAASIAVSKGGGGADTNSNNDNENKRAKKSIKNEIGVHGYINRLLRRLEPQRPVTARLTSHSFRRGGAQHANGCDRLSVQWILDRGGWSMSATNKGFAYIFNTPREDRKVARFLSGWAPEETPLAPDASCLDSRAREGIAHLRDRLFSSSRGHARAELEVDMTVLNALTASLVRHYPRVKALQEGAPLVQRIEQCAREAGHDATQLLAWSAALEVALVDGAAAARLGEAAVQAGDEKLLGTGTLDADALVRSAGVDLVPVVAQMLQQVRAMHQRIVVLEGSRAEKNAQAARPGEEGRVGGEVDAAEQPPPKKRKKSSPTSPAATWYDWYTCEPRLWEAGDKQRRSIARHLTAYMRLFIVDGYVLLESSDTYRDDVMSLGEAAQAAMLAFLRERGSRAASSGTVLREMRARHHAGELDSRIAAFQQMRAAALVLDPTPLPSLDILAPKTP